MIVIIRIQAQEKPELLWNDILANKDRLQNVLNGKGRILYLSKRRNYREVSLFVHVADTNILGDFIAGHLAKLEGVTGIWLINMLKPVFHPLPKGVEQMKRYTVTIKAFSPKLSEIYGVLVNLPPADNVSLGYLAYTCHLFGDCIQISLQAPDDTGMQKYVDEVVGKIPGVLRTTLCEIERTHPFVSYEEWQKYISKNSVLVDWDEQHMVAQFQN
ncbi:MAG: hypothetical protein HZA49_06210 [Planctomycetes bacterium]|nr:hypothetical protein [Planctomycetota bacterium]